MVHFPRISITVITYNSSKTIVETLDSAYQQSYPNIELIISDDSSRDDTVVICEKWLSEYGDRFARAEIITSPINTGISPNVNRAFSAAQAEWIKPIAGDDRLRPECIESFVNYVDKNPNKKVLFAAVDFFSDDHAAHFEDVRDNLTRAQRVFDVCVTAAEQYKYLRFVDNFPIAPSTFMNREVWRSVGGFDEDIRMMDDYPMWIKLTKAGVELTLLPDVVCDYRLSTTQGQINNPNTDQTFILLRYKYKYQSPFAVTLIKRINQFDATDKKNKIPLRLLKISSLPFKIIYKIKQTNYKKSRL